MLLLESCCHCYCQPFVFLYCLRGEYLKYIYVCAYIAVYNCLKNSIGRRFCYPTLCVESSLFLFFGCWKPKSLNSVKAGNAENWEMDIDQTRIVTFPFADTSPGLGRWVTPSDWQVMKWPSTKSAKQSLRHLCSAFLHQNKRERGQNKYFVLLYFFQSCNLFLPFKRIFKYLQSWQQHSR